MISQNSGHGKILTPKQFHHFMATTFDAKLAIEESRKLQKLLTCRCYGKWSCSFGLGHQYLYSQQQPQELAWNQQPHCFKKQELKSKKKKTQDHERVGNFTNTVTQALKINPMMVHIKAMINSLLPKEAGLHFKLP